MSGIGATPPQALTVVFMGDSITAGQYVDAQYRWTNLLSDQLFREYWETEVILHFVCRGISGETTRQGLERFPMDVQAAVPDVLTLQFGLNDCNCWVTDRGMPRVSEDAYRANLVEMIHRARVFGAREIILITNHVTLRDNVLITGESLNQRRQRYNEIKRDVVHDTGVQLCDMERAFERAVRSRALADLLLPFPDLLHLSIEGHKVYANAVEPYLKGAIRSALKGTTGDEQ